MNELGLCRRWCGFGSFMTYCHETPPPNTPIMLVLVVYIEYYCAQNFSREMPAVKSVIMHINT